MLYIL